MSTKLETFIAHARSKGMDHQTIRMLLLSSGWKEKDISAGLASETLDMPVPVPRDTGSAKDAFFHLLVFTSLYATVISLIILAFDYISRWFPDAATDYVYQTSDVSAIRWAIAVIVVSFPLFALLSRAVHRDYVLQPEKLASGVRRWLTYLTLFVTACTLVGDAITLLFYLLNGEMTLRFICKVVAIFVLTGLPFAYYFQALRMDSEHYAESMMHRNFLWTSVVVTVLFVAYGIFVAGTPMTGRAERFDEQRLSDLRSIENEILNEVWGVNRGVMTSPPPTKLPKPLPNTLEDVAANAQYQKLRIADPETNIPYEYFPSDTTYQLCAVFTLTRDLSYDIFWNHGVGRTCFTINALEQQVK